MACSGVRNSWLYIGKELILDRSRLRFCARCKQGFALRAELADVEHPRQQNAENTPTEVQMARSRSLSS